MITFGIDASDPIWLQHLAWRLDHITFWVLFLKICFVLFKWVLVFGGIALIAKQSLRNKHLVSLCFFLCIVVLGLWGMFELSVQSLEVTSRARSEAAILLRAIGRFTDVLAIIIINGVYFRILLKRL